MAMSRASGQDQKELLLSTLKEYEQKNGQVPREVLRATFLNILCQPPGSLSSPSRRLVAEGAEEAFVERILDWFPSRDPDPEGVEFAPLVEWLFSDAAAEDDALTAVLVRARQLQRAQDEATAPAAAQQPIAPNLCEGSGAETWNFQRWLIGKASKVVGDALQVPLAEAGCAGLDFAFARALGLVELQRKGEGKHVVVELLKRGNVLHNLAQVIIDSAKELANTEAGTVTELNAKFQSTEGTFKLNYGEVDDFFSGLEDLVGSPNPNVTVAMANEHCKQKDSKAFWTTGNYGICTTAEIEWHFVFDPESWSPQDGWPKEGARNASHPRAPKPLSEFEPTRTHLNFGLSRVGPEELSRDELIGARLYTGPMFEKYNAVNRGGAKSERAQQKQNEHMKRRFADLCMGNRYCTTIHVINSALIKLSRLESAGTLYRGMVDGVLPSCFLQKCQKTQVRGGIEFGFLSTSKQKDVALSYMRDGRPATLLEIKTGMIDRGASLECISQYPHEQEICFPPLACMEVVGSRVDGSTLVLEIRLNVNFSAPTIERVVGKRLRVVEDMCDNLRFETLSYLGSPLWGKVVESEAQAGMIAQLVRQLAEEEFRAITAPAKGKPELFNNDVTLLSAMKRALDFSDSIKWQKTAILQRVAAALRGHGEDDFSKQAAERIERQAEQNEQLEWRILDPIPVKREQTRELNLGGGSSKGHILDTLGLVELNGVISVAKQCSLWPEVERDCVLLKVDSQKGSPGKLVRAIVGNSIRSVTFQRTLEQGELQESLKGILKGTTEQSREETATFAGQCLALNRHLRTVNLQEANLGPQACAALADALGLNRSLQSLFMGTNGADEMTGLALEKAFGVNQTLMTLYIDHNDLGPNGGEAIAKGLKTNRTIQSLRIRKTNLGREGGSAVAKALDVNQSLTLLYIEKNDLGREGGEAFAQALEKNCPLERLHIDSCGLGSDGGRAIARGLKKNTNLRTLWAENNSFGQEGGEALAEMLKANRTLRSLALQDGSLGPAVCGTIADSLEENHSLTELWMANSSIGSEGGQSIARSLRSNRGLEVLRLNGNGLGDEGGRALAEVIQTTNRTLTTLYVNKNGLGKSFAEAIAKAIKVNERFRVLSLEGNAVGAEGAEWLAWAIPQSSGFQTLLAGGNDIGERGGLALAGMLKEDTSLEKLGMLDNKLTQEVGAAIAEAVVHNATLQTLMISQSEIGEQAVSDIRKNFGSRKLQTAKQN